MEQRQLPIILIVMAFFLVVGFTAAEIDYEDFSVPQMLSNIYEWIRWKLMPGW